MIEEEPSIETLMLIRFLEAARPNDILRWHKAELEKLVQLAKEGTYEELLHRVRRGATCPKCGRRVGEETGNTILNSGDAVYYEHAVCPKDEAPV